MKFFNNKMVPIPERILTDSSSTRGTIEAVTGADRSLESFYPIDLHELITTIRGCQNVAVMHQKAAKNSTKSEVCEFAFVDRPIKV